jgi:hypothetical protein
MAMPRVMTYEAIRQQKLEDADKNKPSYDFCNERNERNKWVKFAEQLK